MQSRWLLKTEVQRWDTCPKPTLLRFPNSIEPTWILNPNPIYQHQNPTRWLAKGNFTRDEWYHLLRSKNILNNSILSCSHFSSISYPQTMSKRQTQEGKPGGQEERVVAKWRLAWNLVSVTLNRSSSTQTCCDGFEQKQRIRLSSVVCKYWPDIEYGETSDEIEKELLLHTCVHHNLDILPDGFEHWENIYNFVRQKIGRPKEDKLEQINTNVMIWIWCFTAIMSNPSRTGNLELGIQTETVQ